MSNSTKPVDLQSSEDSLIKQNYGSVTPEEVGVYTQIQAADDQSYKIRTVIDTWKEQQKEERNMRRNIAYFIMGALFIEIIVGNVILFLLGVEKLNLSEWVSNVFYVGMYTQVVAIATIVVRNLFPKPLKDNSASISELIEKL